MELIDQQNAFRENRRVLQHFGWKIHEDGKGHTWFSSPKTNQWSREFPLFALLSNDLKQEVHRLLAQPAPRPSSSHSLVSSPSRHRPPPPPPIGPSSSYSSEPPPPAVQLSSGPPPPPPPYLSPYTNNPPVFSSLCDIQPATVRDGTASSLG